MKPRTQKTEIPRSKVRNGLIIVAVIALLAAGYSFPHVYNKVSDTVNAKVGIPLGHINAPAFQLGLDIRGGAHLEYEADTTNIPLVEQAAAVEGARDMIEQRINPNGVGEQIIQTSQVGNARRISVDLPGVHDVKQAIDIIGDTVKLEFREKGAGLTGDQEKQIADANKQIKDSAITAQQDLKKGMPFDEVFKKYNGKDLGPVTKTQPELFAWASRNKQNAVSDIIEAKEAFYIVQRGVETKEPVDTASHILICWKGAKMCDSQQTKQEAEQKTKELLLKITPQNFADLAKVNSTEPGAAQSGGALGEIHKGQLVKPFEEALFAMKVGEIKGPVESEFGFHIIYKIGEHQESLFALRGAAFTKKSEQDFLIDGEWKATGLSGKQLDHSSVEFDQKTNEPTVSIQFNSEGQKLFGEITKRNVGQAVGIFLDGKLVSKPVVREPILDGRAVISGNFTIDAANTLVKRLKQGSLPLPLKLVSQQTVGATLGAKSLSDSARAGIIGFILVIVFLTIFYRIPGFLASIALVIYVILALAVYKNPVYPITLSLAGITAFILSIGMAVDANVLVFERTREELAKGKSPSAALEEAFPRAWNSIRDSNMSSLITCIILFSFGSNIVRGFALTLAIGIGLSLFTALVVTRLLLRFIAPILKNKPALFVQPKKF